MCDHVGRNMSVEAVLLCIDCVIRRKLLRNSCSWSKKIWTTTSKIFVAGPAAASMYCLPYASISAFFLFLLTNRKIPKVNYRVASNLIMMKSHIMYPRGPEFFIQPHEEFGKVHDISWKESRRMRPRRLTERDAM